VAAHPSLSTGTPLDVPVQPQRRKTPPAHPDRAMVSSPASKKERRERRTPETVPRARSSDLSPRHRRRTWLLEGRSSGSRILRPPSLPSHPSFPRESGQWHRSTVVPGYSDGLAPVFHRLPAVVGLGTPEGEDRPRPPGRGSPSTAMSISCCTDRGRRRQLAQPGLAFADRSRSGTSLAFRRGGSEVGPEADCHVR